MKVILFGGPYDGADFEMHYMDFSDLMMAGAITPIDDPKEILVLGNRKFYQEIIRWDENWHLSEKQILALADSLCPYVPKKIYGNAVHLHYAESAVKAKHESFFDRGTIRREAAKRRKGSA